MSVALRISSWTGGEPPTPSEYWGLYFEAEDPGVTVKMVKFNSAPSVTLETSPDGLTWSPFVVGTDQITLANTGDKVYFRAGEGGNVRFASSTSDYHYFVLSGGFAACHGNIMSLIDGEDSSVATAASYCFTKLFNNCAKLTSAPDMPATTLGQSCYNTMYYGCTALRTGPSSLPAMTLADSCYKSMFYHCEALAGSFTVPATTLAANACDAMFAYCKALTSVTLGATTLAANGYGWIFYECHALSDITVSFTAWNPDGVSPAPTVSWYQNLPATGTFRCPAALGDNSTIDRGSSKCPNGWTVVNI